MFTIPGCDSFYEQARKRAKDKHDPSTESVRSLQHSMSRAGDTARPNNGERYQAQIIVTPAFKHRADDACVLSVLNTSEADKFLAFMMDHQDGLEPLRSKTEHVSPLMLPACMQGDPELTLLNRIIEALYDKMASKEVTWRPSACTPSQWLEFCARVLAAWPRLGLPILRPVLRILRPTAPVGSLVFWRGWHGNCGAPDGIPCVALFVDFAPRPTFDARSMSESYKAICHRPWEFGAGSLACRHAGYNALSNQMHDRSGGLDRLGSALTSLDCYLAGDETRAPASAPPAMLDAEQLAAFDRDGYLVVAPDEMTRHVPEWMQLISKARDDLSAYMTDIIVRRGNLDDQTPLDLARGEDPRWAAVGGSRQDAKRHFGDEYAMYAFDAKGKRCTDARQGGSLLTKQSGMGAAANLYDSPAQMRLQLSCYPAMTQLYRTHELLWLPERFRVRTTRDGALPLHTDTNIRV